MLKLYELRRKKFMPQKEFAEALDVSQQTISLWENGKCSPRADLLPKIAKILGCSIDELFGEKEEA